MKFAHFFFSEKQKTPDSEKSVAEHLNISQPYKFVAEKRTFLCGIDNCEKVFSSAIEHENHLKKNHATVKKFSSPHRDYQTWASGDVKIVKPTNVLRHLHKHRSDMYCCGICNKKSQSIFSIQKHVVHNHPTSEFAYNYEKFDGFLSSTVDVRVKFECNICREQTPSIAMASEHFSVNHPGAIIDFTAIETVTMTKSNAQVVLLPDQRSFLLQKRLMCGVCNAGLVNKNMAIEHFNRMHPSQALEVKLSQILCFNDQKTTSALEFSNWNASFDRNILYDCAHCCGKIYHFNCVQDVFEHWKNVHNGDESLPFRFFAIPLVSCPYCNIMSTFQDLTNHFRQEHPDQLFVAVQSMTPKQCSLCNFSGYGVLDHFRREHGTILQENQINPVCLSDDTIDQLLKINVRKKFKCNRCDEAYESESDIRDHFLDEHSTLKFERIEFYDNQNVQLFSKCCNSEIEQITFFEHLVKHERSFGCPQCLFRTNDSFEFMNHGIEEHRNHTDACTLELNYLKNWFWHSEYVFGNGLILNKHNLVGTTIDDSQRFMEFIQAFVMEREKNFFNN